MVYYLAEDVFKKKKIFLKILLCISVRFFGTKSHLLFYVLLWLWAVILQNTTLQISQIFEPFLDLSLPVTEEKVGNLNWSVR